MAVVAAVELDDLLASGERARQPDRRQRGLGTGVDEADHLDRRKGLADQLGKLDLAPGRRAEAGAVAGALGNRLDDAGVGVSEDQRSPGAEVVEILIAVLVPDPGAEAPPDEQRVAPDRFEGANGAVDASRQESNGALVEGARALSPWSGHRASHRQRSFAKYVMITSAPARLMPTRISVATRSSSIQPLRAAALTMAYSPLTL